MFGAGHGKESHQINNKRILLNKLFTYIFLKKESGQNYQLCALQIPT